MHKQGKPQFPKYIDPNHSRFDVPVPDLNTLKWIQNYRTNTDNNTHQIVSYNLPNYTTSQTKPNVNCSPVTVIHNTYTLIHRMNKSPKLESFLHPLICQHQIML